MSLEQFNKLSLLLTKKLSKEVKKSQGIYFTPRSISNQLVSTALSFLKNKNNLSILEPSCGSCELVQVLDDLLDNASFTCYELNEDIFQSLSKLTFKSKINFINNDFIKINDDNLYDLVIGNPPYFEIRNLDAKTRQRYKQVIGGRPNIFSLFFAVGLGALKPNGVLGYVVPPSMNNGAFFTKLRSYISQSASIEFLKVYTDSDLFLDAQTAVQLIVLRKGKTSSKHVIDLGKLAKSTEQREIFVEDTASFRNEFIDRTNLWNLGYKATTGSLVWNKNKNMLRNFPEKDSVPLIWAHNITTESDIVIDEGHPKKLQHILSKEFLVGPAIVVNRITGSVGQGSLRCALIPDGYKFIGENHVNVITKRKDITPLVTLEEVLKLLRKTGINEKVQKLTGNTQISCVELTHFLPLDIKLDSLEVSTLF
jgi:adenine-specific DNA-methyltransferase